MASQGAKPIGPTPEREGAGSYGSTSAQPDPVAHRSLAGAGPKAWQIASQVLPVLLTAWLTFVFSRSEARVTQELELQKQAFAQQMQLSGDLYKRRFETYDTLYGQLVVLQNTIDHLSAGRSPVVWNRRLADSLAELDTMRKMNRLHISNAVYDAMGNAWQRGSRLNGAQFAKDIADVEAQMDSELRNVMEQELSLKKSTDQSEKSPQKN